MNSDKTSEKAARSATPEGTQAYAARFAGTTAEGHFRQAQSLHWSSLGIGTYLGNPDEATDRGYAESVVAAVRSGINVIDSAINYRFQRSERSIGAALQQLFAEGFAREELILCTKGGYLTPDGELPANPRDYFQREFFTPGILRAEDVAAGCHSIAPRYLKDQIGRSLRNLGVDCVDVYYLHNPEQQLDDFPREEFLRRVRAAFEFLESSVAAGTIRVYGMATWNGFRVSPKAQGYLGLEELVGIARSVAGDTHHFRVAQVPHNLAMPEALSAGNQAVNGKTVSTLEAAEELGITLVGSASLMQGRLSRGLPEKMKEVFGLETDHHRALQFVRSSPGVTTALVGMSRVAHVTENLKLASIPPAPLDQFRKLFDS
ncbi:MAG: aldo/keto reductase [Acidobacteria bacterium]|nr:aldo/keto reductase [Acidobacteriota bacterium]